MKSEKSCGAVVFYAKKPPVRVLLLKHINGGHWSFPKGHVEQGENEAETALREIKEETGLSVKLDTSYRKTVSYSPRRGIRKTVVYFIAESDSLDARPQEGEISRIRWIDIRDASNCVTHPNDKRILLNAIRYFTREKKDL